MATTFQVTFDAADPRALGDFWCEVLGYVRDAPPEGFATWEEALTAWGLPEERWNDKNALRDPDGAGPRIFIQKVPEPKTAKNRVHLDVNVGAGLRGEERVARLRAEADRVESLGATRVTEGSELGDFWIVMRDPEGNEFCLQ
ncbi:VOC family protein [Promicromonospora thailandica]|uniref:Glyoxalase-like domain-containing protein n=1 Tax=Promicromonospora thailandica TaxID=765201 RepID=A0A9X2JXP5_9MICO|nr:VOC family protein [Promicromonospora thailandica]MCP2266792.1 Glyoxalase-like domain-containing protein [Promicromonospora thailandica]